MTRARAPYLAWARSRPEPAVDLAGSNLLACPLSELPGARDAVDLTGDSPAGYRPLVDAIAAYAGVSSDRIATAGGCSGANFLACAAMLDPGDEALMEWPGYDPLSAAAHMAGASVRTFERRFEEGWAVDPDRIAAAWTPRTKLLLLSSPHNPSGVAVPPETLAAVAALAERSGARVLLDEVYADTMETPPAGPAAAIHPSIVSTSSLTKAYGLAALRCGWAIAEPRAASEIRRVRGLVDGSTPIPAERLAALAFASLERLANRARRIHEPNRRLWTSFLEKHPELECVSSASSIVFPRFADCRDAAPFSDRLLALEGVAVAPGHFFGAPSHFRVSLGGSTENLNRGLQAMDRLRAP